MSNSNTIKLHMDQVKDAIDSRDISLTLLKLAELHDFAISWYIDFNLPAPGIIGDDIKWFPIEDETWDILSYRASTLLIWNDRIGKTAISLHHMITVVAAIIVSLNYSPSKLRWAYLEVSEESEKVKIEAMKRFISNSEERSL